MHFWYLTSTILGILLFSLLLKKFKLTSIAAVAAVNSAVLTTLMSTDAGASALSYVPDIVMNTLRYSLPCLALGALCTGRESGHGRKRGRVISAAAITLYFLIDILLFLLFGTEISMPIWNITKLFAAVAIVYLASGFFFTKSSEVFRTMRSLSTLIYCSHLLLMSEGYRYLAAVTGFRPLEESYPLRFILTVLFAFSVSFLILRLSKIKSMRLLKYLY